MVHLLKLAVGIGDVAHLRRVQAARLLATPPLRHQTRNRPRRADEIVEGGSIYWVIAGGILARQRVLAIIDDAWDDGSRCAGLVLDPALVRVAFRPVKAFQGWRYLEAEDAPEDLVEGDAGPEAAAMPAGLERALRALCLI